MKDETDFLPVDENLKAFFKLILSFSVCTARHATSIQNSKFSFSLKFIKKEVIDEVDFFHAGNHQNLVQVDFNTLINKVL